MDFVSEEEQLGELRFGLMEEVNAAKATIERLQRFIDRSQALLQSLDKKAGDHEHEPNKLDVAAQAPARIGDQYLTSACESLADSVVIQKLQCAHRHSRQTLWMSSASYL
jgi:hypothetical protein